jgi:hypothetical protein
MSIALYAMFSLTKQFSKLCITLGFELTISCIPQGCANRCTTSVDTENSLCMVLVYLLLHVGEIVTLRLVSDIRRGARRATQAGHCVTCMGLPGHLDSPVPESEVWALRLRRPATGQGLGAGAVIVTVAISACGQAQCHAHRFFKPDSTPLQNKIKLSASLRACWPVNLKNTFEEVNQRMLLSGHLLSLER